MIKLNKNVVVNNFLHEEKKEDKDINKKLIKDGALEPLEHEHVENNPESVEKHIEAAKKHADKEKEKSKKLADKIAVKQKAVLFSESLKFKDRTSLTEFLLKLREQKIRRKIVPLHEDAEGYRYEVRYEKPLKESIPSFSELEEWCMNNPVEMLRTIDRIRKDEMTDGDRQIFNDFGLDNYSKKELKQLLDRLENETYSWIYDSGDFDDEQIKKIEKELGESLKEASVPVELKNAERKYSSIARKLVNKAKKDGHKLSLKDALRLIDENGIKDDNDIDSFYASLDFNKSLKEDENDAEELPREVTFTAAEVALDMDSQAEDDEYMSELLGDMLSDTYGFCHFGFKYEVEYNEYGEPSEFRCYDIKWDTSESLKEDKNCCKIMYNDEFIKDEDGNDRVFTKDEAREYIDSVDINDKNNYSIHNCDESLKEDNNNGPEYNYWFEVVKDYLNNRLEDRTSDERLVKATDKDINDIAGRVVNKILNDDEVWSVIDNAIEYNILNDEFLVDADMKDEDVKEETKFNNLNEAWDFSDEDERASRLFAKDLEDNSNADDFDDVKVLKEKVEKRIIKKQTTNSMWDFGDDE